MEHEKEKLDSHQKTITSAPSQENPRPRKSKSTNKAFLLFSRPTITNHFLKVFLNPPLMSSQFTSFMVALLLPFLYPPSNHLPKTLDIMFSFSFRSSAESKTVDGLNPAGCVASSIDSPKWRCSTTCMKSLPHTHMAAGMGTDVRTSRRNTPSDT